MAVGLARARFGIAWRARRDGRRLGGAVGALDAAVERRAGLLDERGGDAGTAARDEPEGRDARRIELRRAHQRYEEGGWSDHEADPLTFHDLEGGVGVPSLHE